MNAVKHDVLIIGSGAAGLTAALALAETKKVLVLAILNKLEKMKVNQWLQELQWQWLVGGVDINWVV